MPTFPRPRSPVGAGCVALVAGMLVAGTDHGAAQTVAGSLVPGGHLNVEYTPSFASWNERFGFRQEGGTIVEEIEPLGFDLDDDVGSKLFPGVADLDGALDALLGDFAPSFGSSRARVSASRVEQRLRLAVGAADWLTLGVTVPFVRNRTEIAFSLRADSTNANLGLNPAILRPTDLTAFTDDLAAAAGDAADRAALLCAGAPGSPECSAVAALAAEGDALLTGFLAAYSASPLFPVEGTAAAEALAMRVAAFDAGLAEQGFTTLSTQPLFAPSRLDGEQFDALLSDGTVGLGSPTLRDRVGLWELGDVEVDATVRLLSGRLVDSTGASRGRYLVGAGGLLRLGTGTEDDPDVFLDLAAGDGQSDIEGRLIGTFELGRVGVWADARLGVQAARTMVRRVGPPDLVLVPSSGRATVEWTPGSYRALEVSPRFQVTGDIALDLGYRWYDRDADTFERVSAATPPDDETPLPSPPYFEDVTLLESETAQTLHALGGGLTFSTLAAWREGRTGLPFEARVEAFWGVAGAGGQTPKGVRTTVRFRLYRRLWGG